MANIVIKNDSFDETLTVYIHDEQSTFPPSQAGKLAPHEELVLEAKRTRKIIIEVRE